MLAGAAASFVSASAWAGQVQQIQNFGTNPSGISMYLYTPSNVAAKPPVLVGVHACHGKATDVCTPGTGWVTQADKYGFLLVCPSAASSDGCWDVHSNAVLTHDGGGDASGIVSMVKYVVQNKNADASRVYVGGHSSGGMMTNVLIGSYPDVFKAGAAFAGVPFGCFAIGGVDGTGWDTTCATGNVTQTGMQWGDRVRGAYPGFTGPRPRMEVWHGTVDATVNFHNFSQEIAEWTNVLGVSSTPTTTENNAIQSSWIRTRYTDTSGVVQVEAIQETGQPHNLVVDVAEAVHFFGLDGSNPLGDAGVGHPAGDASVGMDAAADATSGSAHSDAASGVSDAGGGDARGATGTDVGPAGSGDASSVGATGSSGDMGGGATRDASGAANMGSRAGGAGSATGASGSTAGSITGTDGTGRGTNDPDAASGGTGVAAGQGTGDGSSGGCSLAPARHRTPWSCVEALLALTMVALARRPRSRRGPPRD